jgi:hypothetical protein
MTHMYHLSSANYVNIWWTVTVMLLITEHSTSLCFYLPLTSNILLTTLLSITLNLFSSLDITDQISHMRAHTHTQITGKMSVS